MLRDQRQSHLALPFKTQFTYHLFNEVFIEPQDRQRYSCCAVSPAVCNIIHLIVTDDCSLGRGYHVLFIFHHQLCSARFLGYILCIQNIR